MTEAVVVDRVLGRGALRLALWLGALRLYLPDVLREPLRVSQHYDDHYFYMLEDVARRALLVYHELPVYNPFYCGGIPGLAHPQAGVLAPDFLLRLAFGTGPGRRLAIVLFFLLGLEGVYRLGRHYGLTALGAAAAAVCFATSGRFTHLIDRGWLNMLPYYLLPWVVLAFERSLRSWHWGILGGAGVAWMALCGGTYTVPFTVLVLVCLVVVRTADAGALLKAEGGLAWRGLARPSLALGLIGVVAVGLSAVRLLPLVRIVFERPRYWLPVERLPVARLWAALVSGSDGPQISADLAYLGWGTCALALLGGLAGGRLGRGALLGAATFFVVALGDWGSWSPYHLLHRLPVYDQLRHPLRYTIVCAFFLALAAGAGVTALARGPEQLVAVVTRRWERLGRRMPKAALLRGVGAGLACVAVAAVVAQLLVHNRLWVGRVFTGDEVVEVDNVDFKQARGNRWDAEVWPAMNRGILACWDETKFPESPALRADLQAEEYALEPWAMVRRLAWTPHRIDLEVSATAPATVLVNQNFTRRWTSDVGVVDSYRGLLAVHVEPGTHHLVLRYRDGLVLVGGSISLLFAFGCSLLLVRGPNVPPTTRASRAGPNAAWRQA